MTYRVYIRNNSKVEVRDSLFPPLSLPLVTSISAFALCASIGFFSFFSTDEAETIATSTKSIELISPELEPLGDTMISNDEIETREIEIIDVAQEDFIEPVTEEESVVIYTEEEDSSIEYENHEEVSSVTVHNITEHGTTVVHQHIEPTQPAIETLATEAELLGVITESRNTSNISADKSFKDVIVKKGDNMALIFKRLGLSSNTLHNIMELGKSTAVLKSLNPGEVIKFEIKDNQLKQLSYDYGLNKTLLVNNEAGKFNAETVETEIEKRVKYAAAEINSSLFLAGQKAGITDKVIMNLVSIYGWDIDFALDIRSGDKFAILYEEHFKNGKKINNGPILAAEFINQGHKFRAVRYTHDNGDVNYYSDTGHNMRKAFMRTPVNFSRISSKFNLKRKHPVLNTIRAHKGVDYAAKTGTPIKATGDGMVVYRGTKGGYGRTVILKHGGKYTTLYAHMSKYAKGVTSGKRVKQGQVIGYIGSSGLATGPHLHYEFRINGVHRNPLKVKLPKALKIPDKIMADFKQQTQPILAQLDQFIKSDNVASLPIAESEQTQVLAMRQQQDQPQSVAQ